MSTLVVFSGGQDSTVCLFRAVLHYGAKDVGAITFDYGQRHRREIDAARKIAARAKIQHYVVDLSSLGVLVPSALTRAHIPVSGDGGLAGLPSTFVPGRNLVFLTFAASVAISMGYRSITTGVSEADYSGYPDCRHSTIRALQAAIILGTNKPDFEVQTPLINKSKADIVRMAKHAGPEAWAATGLSITCYQGERPGCGECLACKLRAKGFYEAGEEDPAFG